MSSLKMLHPLTPLPPTRSITPVAMSTEMAWLIEQAGGSKNSFPCSVLSVWSILSKGQSLTCQFPNGFPVAPQPTFHACPESGQLSLLHIRGIYVKEHRTFRPGKLVPMAMGSLLVFSGFLSWLHRKEFGRNPLNFWYKITPPEFLVVS